MRRFSSQESTSNAASNERQIKASNLSDAINFTNGRKRPESKGDIPVYGGNGILEYTNESNQRNCVIIGRVGAYCGSVFYCAKECWVSDNAIAARNKENSDILFDYYLLKWLRLNDRHIGTGQPLMTQEILNSIEYSFPKIEIQRAIAATLTCLDDKIELNNRIIANLEAQAQAIFKSWFVDFEPFQDGEFEESELGLIPKGWMVGTLDEIMEILDSKRIPLSGQLREKMQKIYPYYGATTLMDYVDDYIFDGIYLLLGEDGTVIDANGYPVLQYIWGKFWVNNHAHILQGRSGFSTEALYILLKNTSVNQIVTGAVQAKISQGNLKSITILKPNINCLSQYCDLIEPLFASIRELSDENKMLTIIRDTLLPKLMSGEIEVPVEG